jgi:hypothetical protein
MKKVIRVKLSPQGVADAITELQMYKEDIERRIKLLVKKLTELGADIARAKIASYDAVYSGELLQSINGFMDGSRGIIRVDSKYALFVEFGTGPVGRENPHPLAEASYYKEEPWYTAADGKPMDLIYDWTPIETDDGNIIYIAYGQPAKPFMHETALELEAEIPKIIKEVFG